MRPWTHALRAPTCKSAVFCERQESKREMTLKGFLAANQLPIGIVFSLATKVHRSPHCCNRTRPDSVSSLHKRLATLFMQVQNARVEGPWNLSLRFQKAASVRQCVTWFDPMQRAPKSPFHESVMVEPKLLWRLQVTPRRQLPEVWTACVLQQEDLLMSCYQGNGHSHLWFLNPINKRIWGLGSSGAHL